MTARPHPTAPARLAVGWQPPPQAGQDATPLSLRCHRCGGWCAGYCLDNGITTQPLATCAHWHPAPRPMA